MEFTENEKNLFLRMVEYFIQQEHKEIEELKLPLGNKNFIPECEARLQVYESIRGKVKATFNF